MPHWPRSTKRVRCQAITLLLFAAAAMASAPGAHAQGRHPPIELFIDAASPDERKAERALTALDEWWRDEYACIVVDIARFMQPRGGLGRRGRRQGGDNGGGPGSRAFGTVGAGIGGERRGELPTIEPMAREHPSTRVRERLVRFLEEQTGQSFGDDLGAWRRWYWNRPYAPHPDYPGLKAALYNQVDENMGQFFRAGGSATVRLDEIDWNGMDPGRIPVLDHSKHIPAAEADYLEDDHRVVGIEAGGEARAFPLRILSRHELTLDRVGGTELAIVTDLLCGTVVAYVSETHGSRLNFRPSGLVYRSNRLIFDQETVSLWSTLEGRPVFGPLTLHEGVEVHEYPGVTTSWGDWKALHPDTTVLSLDTGYTLDYSRETLFRRYLRSDRLVFDVPERDDRLKTKEPVLALNLRPTDAAAGARSTLAIKASFLEKKQNRLYHRSFAGRDLVVVTGRDGANRVYDAGETRFVAQEREGRLRDSSGAFWSLGEAALTSEDSETGPKTRLPARRVFWFAWHAQFPDTELVK